MTRAVAYELLRRVEVSDSYANLLLGSLIESNNLNARDARFVQELGFGAIRQKGLYKQIIELASGREWDQISPEAQIILRLGAYQLLDMRVTNYAAVSESVSLAKETNNHKLAGFVNAVLRKVGLKSKQDWLTEIEKSIQDETSKFSIRYSHPKWIVEAIKNALEARSMGSQLESALAANNQPAKVSLVAIPNLSTPEELENIGTVVGRVSPIGCEINQNPATLPAVRNGRVRVQDQGSQLAALVFTAPEVECEDDYWLDMCAGPGGKSAVLGGIAKGRKIRFQSNEPQPHRAKLVRAGLAPIIDEVELTELDGREISTKLGYSRILIDAPCSGLGALRRRPEARWRKQPSDLKDLVLLQEQLLENAWRLIRPGGLICYVTCSPHLSETTGVISKFLKNHKHGAALLNANQELNKISNHKFDDSVNTAQLWPHRDGTDGMFIALLKKSVI